MCIILLLWVLLSVLFNQIREHFEVFNDRCIMKNAFAYKCFKRCQLHQTNECQWSVSPCQVLWKVIKKWEDLCRPLKYGKIHTLWYDSKERDWQESERKLIRRDHQFSSTHNIHISLTSWICMNSHTSPSKAPHHLLKRFKGRLSFCLHIPFLTLVRLLYLSFSFSVCFSASSSTKTYQNHQTLAI